MSPILLFFDKITCKKNNIFLFILIINFSFVSFSQCNLNVQSSSNNIGCGDCVTLSAQGQVLNPVFEEDFNSGSPVGWDFSQIVIISNNTCVPSPDGTDYMWMGNNSAAPRSMETMAYDLSIGGQICFEMRYSDKFEQPNGSPIGAPNPHCEDPDEIDEGVYLQYSLDNGLTWVTIDYWAPVLGGFPGPQTIWDNYCVSIPVAAQTPNTKIRWYQDLSSGAIYDNWGLDNIKISANIPVTNYEITWLHDNFSHGQGNYNVSHPNLACPNTDTIYTAIMTNGIDTCSASVNVDIDFVNIDNISVINPTCGAVEGQLTVSASGGTGNYTYSVDNGLTFQSSPLFNPLDTANYAVVLLDQNNCSDTAFASIVGVDSLEFDDILVTHPCDNNILGEMTFNVIGGTLNYQYSIDGGTTFSSSNTFSGLNQGVYNILVMDGANCFLDTTITLILPSSPLAGVLLAQDVLCFGESNGSIDLTISGGFSPYNINWSSGSSAEDIFNLIADNYTVTIVDNNGCSFQENVTVDEPAPLLLNTIAQNVTCTDGNDGSIDLQLSGGNTPYTYLWSNSMTSQDVNSLSVSTYNVVVTDDKGCKDSILTDINQPINPLSLTETHVDVDCHGGSTASIDLFVNGGAFPYTFDWSNSQTSEDIINLLPGVYSVVVTDNDNCVEDLTVNIDQPLSPLSVSETHVDALCIATQTGSIDLTVSGGTPGYLYNWSNGQTSEDVNLLFAGIYDVTIIDDNGCQISSSISIIDPSSSITATSNINDVSCHGFADGEIDLTVTGGNPIYVFDWSNSSTSEDLSGLDIGNYYVTITDDIGCHFFLSVDITQPLAPLEIDSIITDVVCFGDNTGAIDIITSGGTLPYTYNWNNSSTTEDLLNIPAGFYSIQVIDDHGCNVSADMDVNHIHPELVVVVDSYSDVSCYQGDDAYINVIVSGGMPAYTLLWNNAQTSQNISNLAAGNYVLNIEDDLGCTTTFAMDIDEPDTLIYFDPIISHVNCYGGNDGEIFLNVNGGTAPYFYDWSNSSNSAAINSLNSGVYSVVVTDFLGCQDSMTIDITQPLAPLVVTATTDAPPCYGLPGGSIDVSVDGGTFPYTYFWNVSQNQTSQDLSNILAGQYQLSVTDDNNCVFFLLVNLDEEFDTIIVSSVINDVSCFGYNDGSIDLDITGGALPYSVTWNDAVTDLDRDSVVAGIYDIQIIDDNGCEVLANYIVNQPDELDASFDFDVSSGCLPLTVNFTNTSQGTSSFCEWSFGNGDVINDCGNVSYTFDQPGCYDISLLTMINSECYDEINLNEVICVHPNPTAQFNTSNSMIDFYSGELSFINTSINATSYEWNFGDASPLSDEVNPTHFFPSGIEAGYEVVLFAFDDNGCSDTAIMTVSMEADLLVHIPNSFTITGDGINESFTPVFSHPEKIKKYQIEIFNRWGEIVFASNDINHFWDGTHGRKNKVVQEGTYTWKIEFTSSQNLDKTMVGHINLLK